MNSNVLITGESGSGKERFARLVHEESSRATGPFVPVNCGAIAEALLESELFGHVRGAFTGATADRTGLFEAANTGTLFLDEIGDVSPGMQVKLLRVLQEREVRRVGENRTRHVDVRVIAATNRDLAKGVAEGAFRQDLYYRLKVIELRVPALRDRGGDILPLARVLLANVALRMKRRITGLAPAVADQLLRYEWPGNVRELENAMEHAVALARGTRVELEDLPEEVRLAPPRPPSARGSTPPAREAEPAALSPLPDDGAVCSLEELERLHILAALARNGGNQTRTAEQLQIGSATRKGSRTRIERGYDMVRSLRGGPSCKHRANRHDRGRTSSDPAPAVGVVGGLHQSDGRLDSVLRCEYRLTHGRPLPHHRR